MTDSVLIVDDEQHVLKSLQRLLRRDGYEIHLAESGRAALDILSKTEIAVMICDQRMPGMSGSEVLAEVYKRYRDTVRITLTGYTDLASAQASINDGHVNQFLLKPWDDEQLRSVVADSVRVYRLVRDNRRLQALTHQQKEKLERWTVRLEEQVQERTDELRAQNENLTHLQTRIEQSLRDTVGLLAATLEAHSPNLGIHCKRVAHLAHQLASQSALDDQEVRDVEFAAHLHDIGKIARYAGDEGASRWHSGEQLYHSAHRHTETGYDILSKVSGFKGIALAVRHQNEHFDGTGTPNGMSGESIPLAARVIAVANAYDKAIHPSSEQAEFLPARGRATLIRGSGTHFDPRLVELLLEYIKQVGATTDGEGEVELSPKRLKEGMVLSRQLLNSNGTLLLKAETPLTMEMIQRIRRMSSANPMLTGVFVRCAEHPPIEHEGGSVNTTSKSLPGAIKATSQSRSTQGTPRVPDAAVEATDDHCGTLLEASHTPEPKSIPSVPSPVKTSSQTRKRILVVDDSTLVCSALKRELRPAGIETIATENGWTALNLIKQEHFDAVLVDLMMPAMTGEELVARLQECAPTLPCIILTGNATKGRVVTLSKEPNVVGIMTKPWDHDRLMATITTAFATGEHKPAGEPV